MPKITYLKEFEGVLWARLELDMDPKDGPVHVFTETEIRRLILETKAKERADVLEELQAVTNKWQYDE